MSTASPRASIGQFQTRTEATTDWFRSGAATNFAALHAVRHILKTAPKVSERPRVRARFHPKNSAPGVDRRALGRIGNIQNKLLKALYGKGSPKNSSKGGHALM
jgi:hypothetical protein